MRQEPGNIISSVHLNVAAMDTGNPSILYDWSVTDGNPLCFSPAQTIQLAVQTERQKNNNWFNPNSLVFVF